MAALNPIARSPASGMPVLRRRAIGLRAGQTEDSRYAWSPSAQPQASRGETISAEPGPGRVQTLIEIPTALSGSITIALIVLLGIFAYPWLLGRRYGRTLVALATLLLAALFMAFEAGNEAATATRIVLAGLLGLAPAVAGIIVMRLQRRARP